MSLSSFLLAKTGAAVDNELDSLFKHAPKPIERPTAPAATATTSAEPSSSSAPKKSDDASSKKKRKVVGAAAGPSSAKKLKTEAAPKDKKKKEKRLKESSPEPKKTKSKKDSAPAEESSEDEEDNSDLEKRYLAGKQKAKADDAMDVDEPEEASDADVDPSTLVHESLQAGGKSVSRSGKQKYVPAEETAEKRDQRTVFVGNLPLAVASKRPLQKQLNKHILALVPNAKIESVRFRSVPFQTPTSKLPNSDDEGDSSSKPKKPLPPQSKSFSERPDNHATKRSSGYKTKLAAADDDDVIKQDEKQFLTPAQKKKIAFIHQDFHNEADSVNAYVVFAHPIPKDSWPKNLPPPKETMDPYEAAAMAVERCNNTVFMERIIRVDRVGQVAKGLAKVTAKEGEDSAAAAPGALVDADPKFTVFVGNLDFASKEEDLRVFFENLMVAEKGAREEDDDEEEVVEGVKKARTWVVRVRIVRDKDTQLGKGFAYVQFADKECVDEVLAMDETKLKFAKRKLRVQRCKTLPGSSVKVKPTTPKSKDGKDKKSSKSTRGPPVVVPKGDPTLGERLAHLPKEVRKQAKAADGDRIARRMAKKKARMAMGAGKDKVGEKERLRAPKGKKTVNSGKKTSKPRVRNEKNAERRNAKK